MQNPKISITERDLEVFKALSKYHLTGRMVYNLSQTFDQPFSSVHNARARLGQLYQNKFIKRGIRFIDSKMKNEGYYYLTPLAASFFDELRHLIHKDGIFQPRGFSRQAHSFTISEIMIKLEQDVHHFKDICRTKGIIRENYFTVKGTKTGTIRPDGSIFLNVNGKNYLLFLEVDMSTETLQSKKPKTRTFERKIKIYSEFKKPFWQDEIIHSLPGITGYRVITVCLSKERAQNLMNLANTMGKNQMFWFTTKELFFSKNCLFDRIWGCPDGQFYPLF